nr:MAG TPA: helix-turn-helix domain protein [Caudoviricetes sp.]
MFYGLSTIYFKFLEIFIYNFIFYGYNEFKLEVIAMNKYLIKKLKEGRSNKGLRQSDVTKITGIKTTTLSNYENGVTEPDIDTFLMLCDLYDLDFYEILGEGYGYKVSGADFDIRISEIEHLKKYRTLDEHGKDIIDILLEKEFQRCAASYNERTLLEDVKRECEKIDAEMEAKNKKHTLFGA